MIKNKQNLIKKYTNLLSNQINNHKQSNINHSIKIYNLNHFTNNKNNLNIKTLSNNNQSILNNNYLIKVTVHFDSLFLGILLLNLVASLKISFFQIIQVFKIITIIIMLDRIIILCSFPLFTTKLILLLLIYLEMPLVLDNNR